MLDAVLHFITDASVFANSEAESISKECRHCHYTAIGVCVGIAISICVIPIPLVPLHRYHHRFHRSCRS